MWDQPEVHEIYRDWRAVGDAYPDPKYFVGEVWVPSASRLRPTSDRTSCIRRSASISSSRGTRPASGRRSRRGSPHPRVRLPGRCPTMTCTAPSPDMGRPSCWTRSIRQT
jgi:hypothetical protein